MSTFIESLSSVVVVSLRMRQISHCVLISVFEWATRQSVEVLRGMASCGLVRYCPGEIFVSRFLP